MSDHRAPFVAYRHARQSPDAVRFFLWRTSESLRAASEIDRWTVECLGRLLRRLDENEQGARELTEIWSAIRPKKGDGFDEIVDQPASQSLGTLIGGLESEMRNVYGDYRLVGTIETRNKDGEIEKVEVTTERNPNRIEGSSVAMAKIAVEAIWRVEQHMEKVYGEWAGDL